MYHRLLKIRLVEEAVAAEYKQQEMKCPVHLSIGQEAAAAGFLACLENNDAVFSTHRCHSHYLGKGGDLNGMIAELYGKRNGCARGLGGSMHLVDESVSMMGSSAIVGGSIPLGVGAALAFKMSGVKQVAVSFFGDGAAEEGVFHESMNFASLKKLPVVFYCENNLFATSSPLVARKPQDNIYEHGRIFGIPGHVVDGNDVVEVYETSKKVVDKVRNGEGPALIEARTYRLMKHVGPEPDKTSGTRTPQEWDEWREKCPLKRFESYCIKEKLLSKEEQQGIRASISCEIERAFELARASEPAEWIS